MKLYNYKYNSISTSMGKRKGTQLTERQPEGDKEKAARARVGNDGNQMNSESVWLLYIYVGELKHLHSKSHVVHKKRELELEYLPLSLVG